MASNVFTDKPFSQPAKSPPSSGGMSSKDPNQNTNPNFETKQTQSNMNNVTPIVSNPKTSGNKGGSRGGGNNNSSGKQDLYVEVTDQGVSREVLSAPDSRAKTGQQLSDSNVREIFPTLGQRNVQTVSQQEQQRNYANQLSSDYNPSSQSVPRTVSGKESMTPSQQDQYTYNQTHNYDAIVARNNPLGIVDRFEAPYRQRNEELIYSDFRVKNVPEIAGTTTVLFATGAAKGFLHIPELFSPVDYEGNLQIPIITPTYQFGKYLISGDYIPELATNPAGFAGQFAGMYGGLKYTPLGKIAEVETKAYTFPFENSPRFRSGDILKGTINEFPGGVSSSVRANQWLKDVGINSKSFDVYDAPLSQLSVLKTEARVKGPSGEDLFFPYEKPIEVLFGDYPKRAETITMLDFSRPGRTSTVTRAMDAKMNLELVPTHPFESNTLRMNEVFSREVLPSREQISLFSPNTLAYDKLINLESNLLVKGSFRDTLSGVESYNAIAQFRPTLYNFGAMTIEKLPIPKRPSYGGSSKPFKYGSELPEVKASPVDNSQFFNFEPQVTETIMLGRSPSSDIALGRGMRVKLIEPEPVIIPDARVLNEVFGSRSMGPRELSYGFPALDIAPKVGSISRDRQDSFNIISPKFSFDLGTSNIQMPRQQSRQGNDNMFDLALDTASAQDQMLMQRQVSDLAFATPPMAPLESLREFRGGDNFFTEFNKFNPMFSGGGIDDDYMPKRRRVKGQKSFRPQYAPSIEAALFGITGKNPSSNNIFTGLELRPLVR